MYIQHFGVGVVNSPLPAMSNPVVSIAPRPP